MFGIGLLADFIEERVAAIGASFIMGAIAESPFGAAIEAMGRVTEFIESEGVSELDRIAAGELQHLTRPLRFKFHGQELLKKMQDSFSNPASVRLPMWQRGGWAQSRQDWLANDWKHDWRSQPRKPAGSLEEIWIGSSYHHVGGEWVSGRLGFPAPATYSLGIGKGKSRTSRRRRRVSRYRRYGRMAARSLRSDGN